MRPSPVKSLGGSHSQERDIAEEDSKMNLLWVALLAMVASIVEGKPHVTCERTYNKIGCFNQKSIVNTPLVNDRDKRAGKDTGYEVVWHEIVEYLHSLACRCAAEAKKQNFAYFGIRFYGECYGGNAVTVDKNHASDACFQSMTYGKCNDTNEAECGGEANSDYIYKLISDEEKTVDGGYSQWSTWSGCSVECGGGVMTRNRACNNPVPEGKGKNCSSLGKAREYSECGTQACPVDGGLSEWSIFGACSKSCGGGISNRTRSCSSPAPAYGGLDCVGTLIETTACNPEACPVDGGFTSWSEFGACSVTCGKGLKQRSRSCTNPPPSNGGRDCQGLYKESSECDLGACPCPVDGGYSDWKPSGNCSKPCGGGEQEYKRECDNPRPQLGGMDCSVIGPDTDKRACNVQPCPVDGGFSAWSSYGSCSASCGSGFKYRTRQCNNPPAANGGEPCVGDTRQALACIAEHCKGNLARGKATKQSSTGWSGPASKAVDGIKNGRYHAGSCTHTQRDDVPWWRVDLGASHVIGNVKILNRADCCSNRLRQVEVRVGDVDSPKGNPICAFYKHAFRAGESRKLACTFPMTGRYVYIALRVKEWLTLCEVEVFSPDAENVARGKPTKQSSTGWSGISSRAVDGNSAAQYNHDSCTHTHRTQSPWWRVDLGSAVSVGRVKITNRADCCSSRLRDIEVRVGNVDNNPKVNKLCVHYPKAFKAGETRTLYCTAPVTGRYVYVTLRVREWLTLCEVEVYKADTSNLARGKPTKQSSTGHSGSSSRAVDGNKHTNYHQSSCTHTLRQTGAWWRVDLGRPASVGKVVITNRGDCCSSRLRQVEVWVGNVDNAPKSNQLCSYFGSAFRAAETKTLYCSKPVIGRYVYVRIRVNDYLTLCEVKVFSLKGGERVDGGFSQWSAYGNCSKPCGGGIRYSKRTCSNPYPANGGSSCKGSTTRSTPCNTQHCPVDGGLSSWSSWGECSSKCGPGKQYKTRKCNSPIPRYGGSPCVGSYKESRACNSKPCPVDGGYGSWTSYTKCSATCGHGHQHRTRQCNSPSPSHGGSDCSVLGPSSEKKVCHLQRCPRPCSPEYVTRVCEHKTLKLSCPSGSRIRIKSASYGRKTKSYCRRFWSFHWSTKCHARSSDHHVRARCNSKQSCAVPAKNWLFGDPCRFTFKYLEVKHHCCGSTAQPHSATVCEFQSRTISCPLGRKIQVYQAMYGRLNSVQCRRHNYKSTTSCRASSSLSKTKANCDGRTTCVLRASNGVYGDPCVTVHKYLDVKFKCIW